MALSPLSRSLKPTEVPGLVESITVVDLDISNLDARLTEAARIRASPGVVDPDFCVIVGTCCIIDCTCRAAEMSIFEDPANKLQGFLFKMPSEVKNADAPIFYVPSLDAKTAFRVGHGALKIPGDKLVGRVLGLAGELFSGDTLRKQNISPTASVVALTPASA
jgi:hypothetical protein